MCLVARVCCCEKKTVKYTAPPPALDRQASCVNDGKERSFIFSSSVCSSATYV